MSQVIKDSQTATELQTVLSRIIKKLRSQSVAGDKLSLTERSTLRLLDQHTELLPTEIAAMEQVTTQSMSQILNHLQELNYITRKTSDTDKRKAIISLSESGQELVYKRRNERDEWLNKAITKALSAEEQKLLSTLVTVLTKLVDFNED